MQKVIVLVTIVIIVAMIIKIYLRKSRYNEQSSVISHKGTKVLGSVVGVKPKTSFDHNRNQKGQLIEMRIKYNDPSTGGEHIIDYYATMGTPGLHPYVLSASGYIDTGAIGGAFKAINAHKKQLMAQGIKGKELKDAMKEYALKISENPSRTTDSAGYVVFNKSIPVNVYVLPDDGTSDRKIHVEFLYDPKNNSDLFAIG